MTKLTAEQKEANKAANKVRDKAFSARRREYNAAQTAATEKAATSECRKLVEAANADWDREWDDRNRTISDIEREIAELEERKGRIKAQYALSLRPKKEARDAAHVAFRKHERDLQDAVNAQYLDVVGVWYVSQWKIPADVQAQMDAAKIGKEAQ